MIDQPTMVGEIRLGALPGQWPRWLNEIDLALPICAQFVLYGNIHDSHLLPTPDGKFEEAPIGQCLFERVKDRQLGFLLLYDPIDGLRVFPSDAHQAANNALQMHLKWVDLRKEGHQECDPVRLPEVIQAVATCISTRCALIVENASRLIHSANNISEQEAKIFITSGRLARTAVPLRPTATVGQPLFNPVFWLANGIRDLPDWFVVGNERVRPISIPMPDFEARKSVIQNLAPYIQGGVEAKRADKQIDQFAALTEGLTLRSLKSVAQLARDQGHALGDIANAIRCYKVGVPDDPWAKPRLRSKIRQGNEEFRKWVKGQDWAIHKTLDILTRSVMGLSGAQAISSINRPRGVLFFAGPTGVGKTELAKAVSRLVFDDAHACVRFDMSEFSAEHSDARLIGAPPGYLGYDAGGELVNAIRQQPFSVLLFDEIEKAHPRILDKFLQILDDGRLTDGRGDTVHFSESILIFTSNLGMFEERQRTIDDGLGRSFMTTERVPAFDPKSPPSYEAIQEKVRRSIENHFRTRLERPELLNRIGDNIVVFDFIRPSVAKEIFDKNVASVKERVKSVTGAAVSLAPKACEQLLGLCTSDLTHGGRGIGNSLETHLINPLASILFSLNASIGSQVLIESITVGKDGHTQLKCASG